VHGRCASPSTISLSRLDEHVIERFLARAHAQVTHAHQVESPEMAAAELAAEAAAAERSYREALTNVDLRRQIGSADHDRMVAALHDAWQTALAGIPQQTPQSVGPLVQADVDELVAELRRRGDVDSLRELLAAAIQAVFVRPAASRARNLPIEDRVRIVWRGEEPLELPRRGERFAPRAHTW
jgi:hypothetical protein